MDEKKPGGLINSWPSIALITALAANLFWLQAPLKSSRPAERAAFNGTALGDQDAEARLWQDPFEAITKDQQRESSNKGYANRHTTQEVKQQIAHHTERDAQWEMSQGHPSPKQITIMLVMVTGSPYAEGAEWRIRGRFAVLAGLSRSGYKPSDPEHVGYFKMGWPRGEILKQHPVEKARECLTDDPGENCLELTVPFEWFESQDRADEVLLLWIKDDMFEDFPLRRLALFKQALGDNIEIEKNRQTEIKFKIIGPWSSTTLQAMLKVDAKSSELPKWSDFTNQALEGVEIYSPSATAADSLLLKTDSQPTCDAATKDPRREIQKLLLQERKIKFYNVIVTDDVLICALIDELKLRGVNPDKDAIALVSEWDTFYGRALPDTFSKLVQKKDQKPDHHFIRVSYLRGLDGKLAGSESPSSKTADDSGKEETAIKRRELAPLERSEGNSQLDYIPRLATKLKAGESSSGKKITAIGVLGSDVYDKLLLLQSLRVHFPNVIFFTMDLDARLFHSKELNWSRNLIVASSFGLQLEKELQGEIPPFRDSYQTATFLASQLALSPHNQRLKKVATDLGTSIAPLLPVQLFEIGRTDPYLVGEYPRDSGQATERVHPPNPHILKDLSAWDSLTVLLLIGFLLLVLWLIGYFSGTARDVGKIVLDTLRRRPKQKLWFRELIWLLIVLPLILATAICVAHFSGQDEPFSLIDGISIWPAEVTRMVAAYLSLYFLFFQTRHQLRNNKDKLSKAFRLLDRVQSIKETAQRLREKRHQNDSPTATHGGLWQKFKTELRWWWTLRNSININRWDPEKSILTDGGERKVDALQLWKHYNWLGSFKHRVARFLPVLLGYVLSIVILMPLFGYDFPFVPYRGPISYWTDKFVLCFAALTLIFLIFFVVDAAQLCRKFIDNLNHAATKWPEETYREFEKQYGIHQDYLDEWIGVNLIGERTKVIGKLIFYPFVVLFLVIVSRYQFFDRWDWPILLILVFGFNSAYALYAVWVIRRSAENARREAIGKLKHKLLKVLGGERKYLQSEDSEDLELTPSRTVPTRAWGTFRAPSLAFIATKPKPRKDDPDRDQKNADLPEQIRLLIHEIESYDEGAFVPLSKHPVIGALAIPFGGAGILAVLDYLTSM